MYVALAMQCRVIVFAGYPATRSAAAVRGPIKATPREGEEPSLPQAGQDTEPRLLRQLQGGR